MIGPVGPRREGGADDAGLAHQRAGQGGAGDADDLLGRYNRDGDEGILGDLGRRRCRCRRGFGLRRAPPSGGLLGAGLATGLGVVTTISGNCVWALRPGTRPPGRPRLRLPQAAPALLLD